MDDENGGNINIIRGSHLFRAVKALRAPSGEVGDAFLRGEPSDATFDGLSSGWLKGRRHPLTGEPLRTERLSLPPGSIVCCNTHAAHMVSPKAAGTRPRLACQWHFKKRSERTGMTSAPYALPPVLALAAAEGELPPRLAAVLRNAFDPQLTDGNTEY